MHNGLAWAYPIAMETVTLIYNKRLLSGEPPTDLSQLPALDEQIRSKQPAVRTILWDYQSAYYSWGIFASAGAYIFRKKGTNYDLANVGLATPGAVQALSQIISLVKENILPPSVSYSQTEELMGQGKLAMTISGPLGMVEPDQVRDQLWRGPDAGRKWKPGAPVCRSLGSVCQSR